jgi:hypothetical protein
MKAIGLRCVRVRLSARLCAVASLVSLSVVAACELAPHRENFGDLATADRIELHTDTTYIVTDRSQIEAAAVFFDRYRDGWTYVMDGGSAPLFMTFYKSGQAIGTFGVGERFLSVGPARHHPPEAEIAAMVRGLGVPWPRT